jgi:hypothetical protein
MAENTSLKTFRIPKNELEKIDNVCETLGISFGKFMRDAAFHHLKNCDEAIKKNKIPKNDYYKQIRDMIGYDYISE